MSLANAVWASDNQSNSIALRPTPHLLGFHAITARLRHHAESIREIYVASTRNDRRARDLIERARSAGVSVHSVDERRLDELAGSDNHQGVVALVDESSRQRSLDEIIDAATEPPLLLLLDGVTDPHNLGACLRSADAFGALAVIVPKDRAAGLTSTVAKAASGALESLPLVSVTNIARTMRELKERGVWLLGADASGKESLFDADL